jgi:hypothetical protein
MSTFLSISAGAAAADSSALGKIVLFHASSRCAIPFILSLKRKEFFTSDESFVLRERHSRIHFRNSFGFSDWEIESVAAERNDLSDIEKSWRCCLMIPLIQRS